MIKRLKSFYVTCGAWEVSITQILSNLDQISILGAILT